MVTCVFSATPLIGGVFRRAISASGVVAAETSSGAACGTKNP
jgi:carboxylesterase type B